LANEFEPNENIFRIENLSSGANSLAKVYSEQPNLYSNKIVKNNELEMN
jgi:hypothetical protein